MYSTIFKSVIAFCLLLLPISIFADDTSLMLAVVYLDADNREQKLEIALSDNPEITFNNDTLTIAYNGKSDGIRYQYDKVIDLRFDDKTITDISDISFGQNSSKTTRIFYNDRSHIRVICAESIKNVDLFTVGGAKVSAPTQISAMNANIDLSGLGVGVYLLRINKQTFKIIKK